MRIRAKFYGRVQGVFFRANTKEKASELNLNGWVKNKEDGSVEMVVDGEEDSIQALLNWCKKGPGISRIDRINILKENKKGKFSGFEILH